MKRAISIQILILFIVISSPKTLKSQPLTQETSGNEGIVAAGPAPSVKAGLKMLNEGGNAVDAAVATIFNLAVSDYGLFCIGG